MPTRNIDFTAHQEAFIQNLISTGRFENVNEVMRAGLQLLEQQAREDEEKLAVLRQLAIDAFAELDRGEGILLEGEDALREYIAERGRRAAEIVKARSQGE